MRRIYIESILGLCLCFFTSLVFYEVIVFELNTDDESVLEQYEAQALQELFDGIALKQNSEAAQDAMVQYAKSAKKILTTYTNQQDVESEFQIQDWQAGSTQKLILTDNGMWLSLSVGEEWYHFAPDVEQYVYQQIELEDTVIWLFFIGGFVIYGFGHLFIIFRRVDRLESATRQFSNGNFSYRVDASTGVALGRLNQAFNHMADKIAQLIETNRSLTNAIAHEMRTPVFRIQWQAELLGETSITEEQKLKVDSIVEDTEEMETMLDELLYYARLDSGHCDLNMETVSIGPFISSAISNWQKESSLKLGLECAPCVAAYADVALTVDRRLLKRALDNLVRNAFKFASTQIVIELLVNEHKQLLIKVHDDGPGIPALQRDHVFEPFYVGNKARNKAKSGHGIGLSIVERVCHQHGATVFVGESTLLGGAVFTLVFDCVSESLTKPYSNSSAELQ